jgi:LasA protease
MKTNNQFKAVQGIFSRALLLAIFVFFFGAGSLPPVHAQISVSNDPPQTSVSSVFDGYVLSDGQFVYGPTIGDFKVKTYLEANAPHLSNYADALCGRSEYFSINPKVYLTLLEIHSQLISVPDTALLDNPFGLNKGDFIAQIEYLSGKMSEAYYLHVYTYSLRPLSQRTLEPFVTPSGITINVAPDINAGTYAIIAGLAAMDQQNISVILDNSQPNGFYQTYIRLFAGKASDVNNDPLFGKNHITISQEAGALAMPDSPPPVSLLQLPYLRGLSWRFGGVHNTSGGTTFTDASSLDFYPWPIKWGDDTSSMWVVAAASGIPTRYSDCGFKISHSGAVNIGWETVYYHLEGAKFLSGTVNQNEKIGVIANTLAEATCTGGASTGPHLHFSLKYDGNYVAINGTPLSGWYVHAGRSSYDTNPAYMWLERAGVKKYPSNPSYDVLLSEVPPLPPKVISGNIGVAGEVVTYTGGSTTSDGNGSYSITVLSGWTGTVTPSSSCYTYTPPARSYISISSDQISQNYVPSALDPTCAVTNIDIGGMDQYPPGYLLSPGQSTVQSYPGANGGPVVIKSNNGVGIIASLLQYRRPGTTGGWTGITQTMALTDAQISDAYVFPRYDYTDTTRYNSLQIANFDTTATNVTVEIGGVLKGTYPLGIGASQNVVYSGFAGGPVVIRSDNGADIVASLYELKRASTVDSWTGQSQIMGLPFGQLSDTYVIPRYNYTLLDVVPYLVFANAGTQETQVTVTIGGVFQGSYPLLSGQSTVQSYPGANGGPVVIKSNNGVSIIASLLQYRRPGTSGGWTGITQTMALTNGQISDAYVFPRYDYTDTTRYNSLQIANFDTTATNVTVEIGGALKGTYPLGIGVSQNVVYSGFAGGPVVIRSDNGADIVASLYELKRASTVGSWTGQSQIMGLPFGQLSDTYVIPRYNYTLLDVVPYLVFAVP